MDHVPRPLHPHQSIEVPFYDGEDYDGLGFWGFPARTHWNLDKVIQTSQEQPPEEWLKLKTINNAIEYLERLSVALTQSERESWAADISEHLQFLHHISDTLDASNQDARERKAVIIERYEASDPREEGLSTDDIVDIEQIISGIRGFPIPDQKTLMDAMIFFRRAFADHGSNSESHWKLQQVEAFLKKLSALVPHESGWLALDGSGWRVTYGNTGDQFVDEVQEPVQALSNINNEPPSIENEPTHLLDVPMINWDSLKLSEGTSKQRIEGIASRLTGWSRQEAYTAIQDKLKSLQAETDVPIIDSINEEKLCQTTKTGASVPSADPHKWDSETELEKANALSLENLNDKGMEAMADGPLPRTNGWDSEDDLERAIALSLESPSEGDIPGGDHYEAANTAHLPSHSEKPGESGVTEAIDDVNPVKGKQPDNPSPTHPFGANPAHKSGNGKGIAAHWDGNPTTRPYAEICDELAVVVQVLHRGRPAFFGDVKNEIGKSRHDALAFLQSWLFFGTICEFFNVAGIKVQTNLYIHRHNNGQQFVTTNQLLEDLRKWKEKECLLPKEIKIKRARKVDAMLNHASSVAESLDSLECPFGGSEVTLSVIVMCWTLHKAAADTYGCILHIRLAKSQYLNSLFQRNAWCPNQISFATNHWPVILQYYTYLLGPPLVLRDHKSCSEELCASNQVDEDQYETRHHTNCQCALLMECSHFCSHNDPSSLSRYAEPNFEADRQKCVSILQSGGIPLISVSNPLLERFDTQPEVVEFRPGLQYVAISHVWADGMGNPKRNCLPLCQMLALRAYIAPLLLMFDRNQPRLHFWIDTLCIPLVPEEARKSAIIAMKRTYEQAKVVLVLDAELMQHDLPPTPLECVARIMLSSWHRRLWTFQEAALSNRIHFRFRDSCTMEFVFLTAEGLGTMGDEAFSTGKFSVNSSVASQMHGHLCLPWFQPSPGLLPDSTFSLFARKFDQSGFMDCWQGVAWRSTSKQTDQTICVASLLGLDLKRLLETPEDLRMKKLLSMQATFPPSMIFARCPRIQEFGFSWAPSSFLNRLSSITVDSMRDHYLPATEKGLFMKFSGLIFPKNQVMPLLNKVNVWGFHVKVEKGKEILPTDTFQNPYEFGMELNPQSASFVDEWPTYSPQSIALIFRFPVHTRFSHSSQPENRAALVSIYAEDDGIIFARFMCVAIVMQGVDERPRTSDFFSSKRSRRLSQLGDAEPIGDHQMWCVG